MNVCNATPFTVKKMKPFLLIHKHKHMSILRKMSRRSHIKLIMVVTSREGMEAGYNSQEEVIVEFLQ